MENIAKIDIKGNQWNIKDQIARDKVELLEIDIRNTNIYSTEEIDTGKEWINGEHIYRKVFIPTAVNFSSSFINILTAEWIQNIKLITNGMIIRGNISIFGGRYYTRDNKLYFAAGYSVTGTVESIYGAIEYIKKTQ